MRQQAAVLCHVSFRASKKDAKGRVFMQLYDLKIVTFNFRELKLNIYIYIILYIIKLEKKSY